MCGVPHADFDDASGMSVAYLRQYEALDVIIVPRGGASSGTERTVGDAMPAEFFIPSLEHALRAAGVAVGLSFVYQSFR